MQAEIELTVVIPIYKSRQLLRELHQHVSQALDAIESTSEILFVDDACPDKSLEILLDLAKSDARVGVIALSENVGQHEAVLTGLRYARGANVIVMDGDMQDSPDAIRLLLKQLVADKYEVVFAGRRGRYESRPRLLTSRIFKRLLHFSSGVPADAGMFMAMNRSVVTQLNAMQGPQPFVVAMVGCTNARMISIPIDRQVRSIGKSAYSFMGRLRSARRAFLWVLAWKLGKVGIPFPGRRQVPKIKSLVGETFSKDLPQTEAK